MRKGNETKKRRKLLPAMLAVALAAVMIAPMGSGVARAAEGDGSGKTGVYSLTVNLSADKAEYLSDLQAAKVGLRFYQVASGEKNKSYDTYDWTLKEGVFDTDKIKDSFEKAQKQGDIATSNHEFLNMAIEAVGIVTAENSKATEFKTGEFTKAAELDPGIYLVVPVIGDTIETDDDSNITVTTDEWIYTFNPMMISVPTKDPAEDGSRGTAYEYGEWKDAVINAKVEREPALTNISIQKNLLTYETKDPATFVYTIDAEKNGEIVYSNVIAIHMNQAGLSEPRVVKGIPVGSTVRVKEVYTGASYDVKTADPELNDDGKSVRDRIVKDEDGSINTFVFSNDYDHTFHGGGGIENRFEKPEGASSFDVNPVRSKTE